MHRGRTVGKHKLLAFVAFDSAKEKHAVAVASLMPLAGDRRSAAGRGGVAGII
jgi:hypothetical protein